MCAVELCHIIPSARLEREFQLKRPTSVTGLSSQQALFALGHPGCNRYAFHFALFSLHFALCTFHFSLCTLHFALCTCRRECGDTHLYTYKRNQGAAISDAQLARERAADAAYKDLVKRKQHLKDSVRSNKRAFEETGVEEIDSEDSLGVGMTQ